MQPDLSRQAVLSKFCHSQDISRLLKVVASPVGTGFYWDRQARHFPDSPQAPNLRSMARRSRCSVLSQFFGSGETAVAAGRSPGRCQVVSGSSRYKHNGRDRVLWGWWSMCRESSRLVENPPSFVLVFRLKQLPQERQTSESPKPTFAALVNAWQWHQTLLGREGSIQRTFENDLDLTLPESASLDTKDVVCYTI